MRLTWKIDLKSFKEEYSICNGIDSVKIKQKPFMQCWGKGNPVYSRSTLSLSKTDRGQNSMAAHVVSSSLNFFFSIHDYMFKD